jgi:nitroreductase
MVVLFLMMNTNSFLPLKTTTVSPDEMGERCHSFYKLMQQRRSVRFFSEQPVDKKIIEHLILTAGTAPSGAHKQPWTFCAVSNPNLKTAIREAAEKEEYLNYHGRMSDSWLKDLTPLGTDWKKPFLEIAPWLIVVLKNPGSSKERKDKSATMPASRWELPPEYYLRPFTMPAWSL